MVMVFKVLKMNSVEVIKMHKVLKNRWPRSVSKQKVLMVAKIVKVFKVLKCKMNKLTIKSLKSS